MNIKQAQVGAEVVPLEYKYDTIYTITLPRGTLDESGILVVAEYIQTYYRDMLRTQVEFDEEFDWSVVTKAGTLTKRLQKHVYTTVGKEAAEYWPKIAGKVGSMIGDYAPEGQTYHFTFHKKLDWGRGEFGDDTSCFFSEPEKMRKMRDAGIEAVLFFSAEDGVKGIGRALCKQFSPDTMTVFNSYGQLFPEDVMADEHDEGHSKSRQDTKTVRVARVLANLWNTHYRKVILTNNGKLEEYDKILYLNGNQGYLVGPYLATRLVTGQDFRYVPKPPPQCGHCGRNASEESLTVVQWVNGKNISICQVCKDRYFTKCGHCQKEMFLARDKYWTYGDTRYCSVECLNQINLYVCYNCDHVYPKIRMIRLGEGVAPICRDCGIASILQCSECDSLFYTTDDTQHRKVQRAQPGDRLYCPKCNPKRK